MIKTQLKPYIFVTNQDINTTYVFLRKDNQYVKSFPYIPTKFETMSQKQIRNYKEVFNFKFLLWSIFNKQSFKDPMDHRIAVFRFMDLNTSVTGSVILTFFIRKFFSKLESPFMDFYFDDKPISFPQLKRGVAYIIGALVIYNSVRSILRQDHIFDLALEYKEHIIPNELISDNCESQLK